MICFLDLDGVLIDLHRVMQERFNQPEPLDFTNFAACWASKPAINCSSIAMLPGGQAAVDRRWPATAGNNRSRV